MQKFYYANVLVPEAMCTSPSMPTIEMLLEVHVGVMSKCATIVDHRDRVILVTLEIPYTNFSAAAVRFVNSPSVLKIVHNVLGPYISERPDLPFPKFSKCRRYAVMISGCPAVLV